MKGNKASLGQWYSPVEETGQVNAEPMEATGTVSDSAWVQAGGETAKKDTADRAENNDPAWMKENNKSNIKENRDNVIPLDPSAKSGNQALLEFAQATWGADSPEEKPADRANKNDGLTGHDAGHNSDRSGAAESSSRDNNIFMNPGEEDVEHRENEKEDEPEVNGGENHIKVALASRRLYLEKEIAELVVSIRKDIEVKQTFAEELDRINHNLAALLHKERQKKKMITVITIILALLLMVSVGFSLTYFFKAQKQILEKDLTIMELQSGVSSGIINSSSGTGGGIL